MSRLPVLTLGLALVSIACGGARGPVASEPSESAALPTTQSERRVLVSARRATSNRPATPAEAAAWQPQVPTPPTDGTCTQREMPQPGVVMHIMATKNADSSTNTTTVVVDGAGRVLRFSEARGVPQVVLTITNLTPAQRDSAVRAQLGAGPRTLISLDHATGEANASNLASPDDAPLSIHGSTALFDTPPNLGVPRDRAARVRERCTNR
jgi:hypothetical protein